MAKKFPQFLGTYWGIKDGKVRSVDEHAEKGGNKLSWMTPDGHYFEHYVMPGRKSASEVIVVFNLSYVEFVPAGMMGTDFEKRIKQKLAAMLAE